MLQDIQSVIRARSYRFTLHAGDRMTEREISVRNLEEAILSVEAEVIEDYPGDPRGASCLILGFTSDARPWHIQCTYPPNVSVVTAYQPSPEEWVDWKTRKETQS